MSRTIVTMLYCGQGMMTLVEGYDEASSQSADFLALIDCGGNAQEASKGLCYVADKVKARKHLDLVVISHQDRDHVGLLGVLGPLIPGCMSPRPAEKMRKGQIFHGGDDWSPTNKETLRRFAQDVGADIPVPLKSKDSIYGKAQFGPLGGSSSGSVQLRLLISNLSATSMRKNSTSAVVVVDTGSYRVVLPGDATHETMRAINRLEKRDLDQIRPVTALSLPHHGSLTTSAEGSSLAILEKFAQISMAPKHVCVSAGPENRYYHPAKAVVDSFTTVLGSKIANHGYVVYVTSPMASRKRILEHWDTVPTTKGIWSTVSSASDFVAAKVRRVNNPAAMTPVAANETNDIVITLDSNLPVENMVSYRRLPPTLLSGVADAVRYAPAP